MEFDDDYLQRDLYYREHILGSDNDEDDGYDDGQYNDAGEEASMQRVWRDYHVLGYADDDGDDRQTKPRSTRRERTEQPQEIWFQPMSKKYREMYAKRQKEHEKQEAARIIRTNRAVCIAATAAVLIFLLLILL